MHASEIADGRWLASGSRCDVAGHFDTLNPTAGLLRAEQHTDHLRENVPIERPSVAALYADFILAAEHERPKAVSFGLI